MKRREQGSIEERRQGQKYLIRWRVMDDTGHSIRHNEIIRGDYIEAQSALAKRLRPVAGQEPKPERTFGNYAENEWTQYTRNKWKDSTQITAGSFVTRHIVPYFENLLLSKITPSHIVAFQQCLEAKGLSKKTRRNVHTILTTMFNYAVELELILKTPVKRGIAPKLENHEKPALTSEQGWALWDALKAAETMRYRAFYGVLLFTGIRTGEALGLKWEDVDFASHQITIRRNISRGKETTPKTSLSLRTRPLCDELYTALLHHKSMAQYRQASDYVFVSGSGRPANPDQLREALQRVLRATMDIHLGPREDGLHLLRHTSGSIVYRITGSVKEAQAWLGHSSSRITLDTYTHLAAESQQTTAATVFARPAPAVPEQAN
jgi:integrase